MFKIKNFWRRNGEIPATTQLINYLVILSAESGNINGKKPTFEVKSWLKLFKTNT